MNPTQNVFDRLVSRRFDTASVEEVKIIALAMWHERFVPNVTHLSDSEARAAGYVIDKLMRFNCVSQGLKDEYRAILGPLKTRYFVKSAVIVNGCDILAQHWGLSSDLKHQIRQLLTYQTRHYQHTKDMP